MTSVDGEKHKSKCYMVEVVVVKSFKIALEKNKYILYIYIRIY